MQQSATQPERRSDQINYVSSQLPPNAGLLTRLLVRELGGELSRTDVGLLHTLSCGPRRITELAQFEGLAQPTMTLAVKRLEEQALVTRERQTDDGRVVVVSLSEAGATALAEYRGRAGAALGAHLAELTDEEIVALAAATESIARLVSLLQQGPAS